METIRPIQHKLRSHIFSPVQEKEPKSLLGQNHMGHGESSNLPHT